MGRDGNKATGSESVRYHLPTEREEKRRNGKNFEDKYLNF